MANTSDKDRLEKITLEHKRWLRREAKKVSDALDVDYMRDSSRSIADRVLSSDAYREAKCVFFYMSFGREVATDEIIRRAIADGRKLCIPLCRGKGIMDARLYTGEDDLVPGAYGILEPSADAEIVSRDEIDLAVIPCVTCDRNRNRLGHGAGYYDRYLEGSRMTKIALCFEEVMADEIAADRYDIPMDAVVTEKAIYGDL